MTLYDLLAVTALFMPVIAAFDQAKRLHLGLSGYAIALPIGLAVGIGFVWSIYKVMELAQVRSQTYSGRSQAFVALVMLLGATIWIGLAGYCGERIVSASLHFVFRHG